MTSPHRAAQVISQTRQPRVNLWSCIGSLISMMLGGHAPSAFVPVSRSG